MLQQKEAEDYVIGTGVAHSVKDLIQIAFDRLGLEWKEYLKIDPKLFRPAEVDHLLGDPAKSKARLGWQPKTTFKELIEMMVDCDLRLIQRKT
jgi:GDPmannose 4,6-dehydratase